MAVATKNLPETAARPPLNRLALGSLAGTLYVVASLVIVFYALPRLWELGVASALAGSVGPTVGQALLLLVMLAAAAGFVVGGVRLMGPNPPHGKRAGIFSGVVMLLLIVLVTRWAGNLFEGFVYRYHLFADNGPMVGLVSMAAVAVLLLLLAVRLFFRPSFAKWLIRLEDQGWFTTAAYKRSQGQRVRRGTILGILILVGCGIYTLLSHRTLETGPGNWVVAVPFTGTVTVTDPGDLRSLPDNNGLAADAVVDRYTLRDLNDRLAASDLVRIGDPGDSTFKRGDVVHQAQYDAEVTRLSTEAEPKKKPARDGLRPAGGTTEFQSLKLLPHVRFTLPILLTALGLWLGYRLVNFPPFADFLIATEAELNKVSWTTRKRLVQDTIVVLTTMFLVTAFLFVVDAMWVTILGNRFVGVLQTDQGSREAKEIDAQILQLRQEQDTATEAKDTERATRLRDQIERLEKKKATGSRELDW